MSHPKVSIIILNWNGLEDTIECLESLRKITYPNYEVVVVDNGSEGNDAEILAGRFGDYIHLIRNDRNYGFAEGNNIAIRYALANSNPEYILLLNNDTVVHPDFLDRLVAVAESDPHVGIVGPKVYFHKAPHTFQAAGAIVNLWTGHMELIGLNKADEGQYDQLKDVDWVVGCGLLIRRKVIEAIGLLCPEYFALYEETEWCLRCKKAGYRVVYVPESVLWHKGGQATAKIGGFRAYYVGRNQFIFMERNCSRLQFLSFLVFFPLLHLFRNAVWFLIWQRAPGTFVAYVRGIIHGISLVFCNKSFDAKCYGPVMSPRGDKDK